MAATNLGFLARQLLQTELAGRPEEIAGGCLFWGEQLWAGVWQLDELGDAEAFIHDTQRTAAEAGTAWGGVVVVTPPQLEGEPAVSALEEALYVYGFPRAQGLQLGGPDSVMIAAGTPHSAGPDGLEIVEAAPAQLEPLLGAALAPAEQLTAPWRRNSGWLDRCRLLAAQLNGQPAGLVAVYAGEVAGRVVLLWVDEDARGQGLGQALLSHAVADAAQAGRVLLSCWVHRDGRLRYYLARHGFADQLSVLSFPAE